MTPTAICAFLFACIMASGTTVSAQYKLGYISFNDLLSSMPETKRADTTLDQYRQALQQEFDSEQSDYTKEATMLSSRDTLKFSKDLLELKRRDLGDLLAKLQGYDQQANQLLAQKRTALFTPIQNKAEDAIRQVSKQYGYSYIFEKETLHAYPPSDDILPLVKKQLGLR